MRKWKVILLGLASSLPGGCGWDLSTGAVGDLIQDVIFGVMFD